MSSMRKTVGKRIRARWPRPVVRARVEREEEWDNDRIPNGVLFPLFDSIREDIDELEDKVKLLEKHYDVRLDETKARFERIEGGFSMLVRVVGKMTDHLLSNADRELKRSNGLL